MSVVVKIYGKETSLFQFVKYVFTAYREKYPIAFDIVEVNDLDRIIADGIEVIPSISINESVIAYQGDISMEAFAKQAIRLLLKETDYSGLLKILSPTDFSDPSINAINYAKSLGVELDALVRIIHVDQATPIVADSVMAIEYYHENQKREHLDIVAAPLSDTIGDDILTIPIESEYVQGITTDVLLEKSMNFDLIVMGTTGTNNLVTKWLGSISRTMLKKANCPVLVVPPNAVYKKVKNIVFGYSPSPLDSKNIESVFRWANLLNARIHVVHVAKRHTNLKSTDEISQYIGHQYPGQKVSYRTIQAKSTDEGLLHIAHEVGAELLILAKKEKSLWQYLRQGSQTEQMLPIMDIPMLVLHNTLKKCTCGGECKKKGDSKCDH